MKKEKFIIEFDSYECYMSKSMTISKKEFNAQLQYLREKVLEYKDEEINMEEHKNESETPQLYQTIYRFDCGCASTRLKHIKLKPGYVFTK